MGESRILAGRYEVRETRRVGEREELRARDRTLAREVLLVRSRFDVLAGRVASERSLREARARCAPALCGSWPNELSDPEAGGAEVRVITTARRGMARLRAGLGGLAG